MLEKNNKSQIITILENKINPIFEYINFNKVKKMLNKKNFLNSETKFCSVF